MNNIDFLPEWATVSSFVIATAEGKQGMYRGLFAVPGNPAWNLLLDEEGNEVQFPSQDKAELAAARRLIAHLNACGSPQKRFSKNKITPLIATAQSVIDTDGEMNKPQLQLALTHDEGSNY
jgi:hypothetical protein